MSVNLANKTRNDQKNKEEARIREMAPAAMLAGIAYVLAFAEFPVPFSPSFARMDLSDLPALIGAFAYGPGAGIGIELVKNGLQLTTTSTAGVGELANFLMGGFYVFTAGMIWRIRPSKKTAVLSCIAASVAMGVMAAAANYFILLPMFETFLPLDQLIQAFGEFMPFIRTKMDVVLYHAFPFNFLKGLVIGWAAMLIYRKLAPVLPVGQERKAGKNHGIFGKE